MKNYLTLVVLSLFTLSAIAQTDIELQVKKLKSQLEEQVKRNDYLKDALSLREGGQELTTEDVTVKLTKVYAKEAKIYVEGLVKYMGDAEQSLQFSDQDLVDPKGNIYKSFNGGSLNEPNGTFHVPNAVKDINYGFIIIFDKIKEKVPSISLLSIRLYRNGSFTGKPFNFKGVEVQW